MNSPSNAAPYQGRLDSPARRAITNKLPEQVAAAVLEFVSGPLMERSHRIGKPLSEPFDGLFVARRGDYRIINAIDDDNRTVTVKAVEHRRDAYHR